jgi:hypothetical protein
VYLKFTLERVHKDFIVIKSSLAAQKSKPTKTLEILVVLAGELRRTIASAETFEKVSERRNVYTALRATGSQLLPLASPALNLSEESKGYVTTNCGNCAVLHYFITLDSIKVSLIVTFNQNTEQTSKYKREML